MKKLFGFALGVSVGAAMAFPMHGLAAYQTQILSRLVRENLDLKSRLLVQDAEGMVSDA